MSSRAKTQFQTQRRVVQPSKEGMRLDVFISEAFAVSRGLARKWILAGSVFVNRRAVRVASKPVFANAVVECTQAEEPGAAPVSAQKASPVFTVQDIAVIHCDEDWMIINKPPGLPTQPTLDRSRATAVDLAKEWLALKTGKPAYVALHHRLDRDTSGVLLFAVHKRANAGLARAFQERLTQKTYVAIVQGVPQWAGGRHTVDDFLAVQKLPGKRNVVRSVRSGGDRALTHFTLLQAFGEGKTGAALIEARPHTGRMHQIRVHLSEAGFPILGDLNYSGVREWQGLRFDRVQLHALRLELPHPITGEAVRWEAPLPGDMEQALEKLGKIQ